MNSTLQHSPSRPKESVGRNAPALDRVLRHPKLTACMLGDPKRKYTIRELAKATHESYATTWRVVDLLQKLGAIQEERIGASRVISLNLGSPLMIDLRLLHRVVPSPYRRAADSFAQILGRRAGIQEVILFGSAARGTESVGSDLDIAVIVDQKTPEIEAEVMDAATRVQDETRLSLVPMILTPRALKRASAFRESVRSGEVLYARD